MDSNQNELSNNEKFKQNKEIEFSAKDGFSLKLSKSMFVALISLAVSCNQCNKAAKLQKEVDELKEIFEGVTEDAADETANTSQLFTNYQKLQHR